MFWRGIARAASQTIGNFWVDITRITYYLLLPICIVYALFLVSQGVIQNFTQPYTNATLIQPQTVQVQKTDASGNAVKDASGNPVTDPKTGDAFTLSQPNYYTFTGQQGQLMSFQAMSASVTFIKDLTDQ